MRCETCQGSGSIGPLPVPCEDCDGSGISHCCDGIQEQRDPGDETPDLDAAIERLRGYRPLGDCAKGQAGLLLGENGSEQDGDEMPDSELIERLNRIVPDSAFADYQPVSEPAWPDRLGEMERDVTGCAERQTPENATQFKDVVPVVTGCADDCVHPSHKHALDMWYVRLLETAGVELGSVKRPGTHDEWRSLNDK